MKPPEDMEPQPQVKCCNKEDYDKRQLTSRLQLKARHTIQNFYLF